MAVQGAVTLLKVRYQTLLVQKEEGKCLHPKVSVKSERWLLHLPSATMSSTYLNYRYTGSTIAQFLVYHSNKEIMIATCIDRTSCVVALSGQFGTGKAHAGPQFEKGCCICPSMSFFCCSKHLTRFSLLHPQSVGDGAFPALGSSLACSFRVLFSRAFSLPLLLRCNPSPHPTSFPVPASKQL